VVQYVLLLIDNKIQYVLLLIDNIVQYVLLLIDNKIQYVLLLIDNILQYVSFNFSELFTICKPVEQNLYNPWTRSSWTTYIRAVAVLKDPTFKLISLLKPYQLCV